MRFAYVFLGHRSVFFRFFGYVLSISMHFQLVFTSLLRGVIEFSAGSKRISVSAPALSATCCPAAPSPRAVPRPEPPAAHHSKSLRRPAAVAKALLSTFCTHFSLPLGLYSLLRVVGQHHRPLREPLGPTICCLSRPFKRLERTQSRLRACSGRARGGRGRTGCHA